MRPVSQFLLIVFCITLFSIHPPEVHAEKTKPVRVAIFDFPESGSKGYENLSRFLTPENSFQCTSISPEEISDGKLINFDVVIMPGGSGSRQAKALKPEGRAAVRKFIKEGGGYVGICAGAYLASSHYNWSLDIINARVWDRSHWNRGKSNVSIQLTPSGQEVLSKTQSKYNIYYSNGPLLVPDNQPDLPGYEVLASFTSEVARNGAPAEAMTGTHAIIRSKFGSGRVICFSPHAEFKNGPHSLIASGIYWAANQD
ncbi:BPL-N domain-containing protein [Gimesia sp.]|uniref:BPL-N domain-containing protein n=1 Tax=Gimesia sp. TaxID=2024833 RepID=UPI003A8DFFB3